LGITGDVSLCLERVLFERRQVKECSFGDGDLEHENVFELEG
jgi:hypothetical protein